jgi:hypothetical protein
LFTGATGKQVIRLWDIRAKTAVYKLSTGNNSVQSLHWDHTRNDLWASTTADCRSDGFRRLRDAHGGEDDDDDDDDDDESDWGDEQRLWPKKAFHREDYFGEMLNANGHLLCRPRF